MDVTASQPWTAFWLFVVCCHLYLDFSLYRRWKGWTRGTGKGFSLLAIRRDVLKIWLAEVFLQRQLFALSIPRWLFHQGIFWGFIGLTSLSLGKFILLLLSLAGLDGGLREFFASGAGFPFVKIWGDFFGLALIAGCSGAMIRRFVFRPAQLVQDQSDLLLTLYLLVMTLSGFALEGMSLSKLPSGTFDYAFVGKLFMPVRFGISTIETAHAWTWIIHAFGGAAILLYLPHSKLMHSLLAPLVIAMNASEEQVRKDMYWPRIKQYRQKAAK